MILNNNNNNKNNVKRKLVFVGICMYSPLVTEFLFPRRFLRYNIR